MVKLIAIDMDGTLLNTSHEVSKRNVDAINGALEQGVYVTIATGRAYQEALDAIKGESLELPLICLNGAEMRNKKHEITVQQNLEDEQIKLISEILQSEDIYYQVYTDQKIYILDKERELQIYIDIAEKMGQKPEVEKIRQKIQKRIDKGTLVEVDNYKEIYKKDNERVMKILATSHNSAKLDRVKNELSKSEDLAVSSSSQNNIEITNVKAQKGVAIKAIADELNIDLADCMAIGDNLNDVSMLKVVGTSVAMENSPTVVSALADYITVSNEEDGVALAIESALNEDFSKLQYND
ncbi:Cof-type HAD-IIB family hydrolase [Abyssicoccus albus]|uniref:Cof subfamily protein (Haloacid dehalogenase superfamily)/HAD superfamily hydrolase (TIGR01484 family) n=1 Tax=Abyssicoccus albus TaxID=1817405 RepID=A0A3N5BBE2_9BACL|nr:Cof-type HAD-IIB family hydrolase [Abyssicoccus albus]RPF54844.1 hypothetical protein EDD62_1624 [Abyssicoccus albus]